MHFLTLSLWQSINLEQIVQIAIFLIILAVVWAILKAILKMTIRMFTFGCGAILVLGLVLILMRYLQ